MKNIIETIQMIFASIGGWIGWILGGADGFLYALIAFVLVGVAHIIDFYIIGSGSAIRTAVIFFYISNEGISILENTVKIGLPIPERLKNVLEQLKEKNRNG